ncbi:MAG TPA: FAD-dependent thymidylate synthase [Deltaproteobacteria bacterium]|nr:FAD-dependent thymidylate synthase [Deltaproteobacteria bacterium]
MPIQTGLNVILISHTPDPEKVIGSAARLCYSAVDLERLVSRTAAEDQTRFLQQLTAVGHLSPTEHASFTFAVEGISRACSHQLVRHRLASYSQQSQRYVSEAQFGFITPPSIQEDADLKDLFEQTMETIQSSYRRLAERLAEKGYSNEAAREDSRFVLPNAVETKIMITMNARELLHFFSQRLCNRAQWEIRALALAMLRLVQAIAPNIFADAGPPCLSGGCPEGVRSCGRPKEVRALLRVDRDQ